jgi:hypothetical protein
MFRNFVSYLKSFLYLANDPSTPELKCEQIIPPQSTLKYEVRGFDKDQSKAVNCYINLGNSINYFQEISSTKLKKWSIVNLLKVEPLAGKDLNAYYDRFNLKFFYGKSLNSNKIIYTVDSADIVSHELGHALLDALRPDIWSIQSLEVWSFHEAFADIFAFVSIMQYDVVLNKILEETNENLNRSNCASRLGEELGQSIFGKTLRDLSIKYAYVDPASLPKNGSENELYAECHSFGKVFASAWYKIFVKIFEYYNSLNKNSIQSLKLARDCAFSIFVNSIKNVPKTSKFYESASICLLQESAKKNNEINKIVFDVLTEWDLLKSVKILNNSINLDTFKKLSKFDASYKINKDQDRTIIWQKIDRFMQIDQINSLNNKKITPKIMCAMDFYSIFDNTGTLVYQTGDHKESVKEALFCLNYLQDNNNIGKNKMWTIKNNKLIRNFII